MAVDFKTQNVLKVGYEAWEMIGRAPKSVSVVRPLQRGVITDFDIAQKMIRLLLKRLRLPRFTRCRVLVCVPGSLTDVETRAVEEAVKSSAIGSVDLIEQSVAAALGSGMPIDEPVGSMIIDVGGGTTETAVLSLGGVVSSKSIKVGGYDIDHNIQSYLRREHAIAVGDRTAEEIKIAIGSAFPMDDTLKAQVKGRHLLTGIPETVTLTPEEIRWAIDEQIRAILESAIYCLEGVPGELANDLIETGISLVGGGSLLLGLDRRLQEDTGLKVNLVSSPLECVVLGAGRALENFDKFKHFFLTNSKRLRPARSS